MGLVRLIGGVRCRPDAAGDRIPDPVLATVAEIR
jgi:hypothetical protein